VQLGLEAVRERRQGIEGFREVTDGGLQRVRGVGGAVHLADKPREAVHQARHRLPKRRVGRVGDTLKAALPFFEGVEKCL
jgi:hypothetical protein